MSPTVRWSPPLLPPSLFPSPGARLSHVSLQLGIISSFSLSLSLSRLCGTAVATEIYFLLSSPCPFSRVLHRASSSLLYSFTVSPTRLWSLFSRAAVVHSCAARLFVRAFHSRSLVLSLSPVSCSTLLRRVSRPLAFLPPPPPPLGSVSSVPFASFSNLSVG